MASILAYTRCSSALSCNTRVYSHSFRSASAGGSDANCGSHTNARAISERTLARTSRSRRASTVSHVVTRPQQPSALSAARRGCHTYVETMINNPPTKSHTYTHTPPPTHTHTLSVAPSVRLRVNPHRRSNCPRSRRACTSDRVTAARVTPPPPPVDADATSPRQARIEDAARERIVIAEVSSARRACTAWTFSRTWERPASSRVKK